MNTPICKPVTLTTNVDEIIQSVAAVTGKPKAEILSTVIDTPRLRVIANFQTQEQHPIAYMIDEYQQAETKMTREKSVLAIIILLDFFKCEHVYIDSDKTAKYMDYFIECLQTVTRDISDKKSGFHTTLCDWDIRRLSSDKDQLGATKEQFIKLLETMVLFVNEKAVYANSKLFRLFVVALRECTETATDLYQKMYATGHTDYTICKARQDRPKIDWPKSYKIISPIVDLLFY